MGCSEAEAADIEAGIRHSCEQLDGLPIARIMAVIEKTVLSFESTPPQSGVNITSIVPASNHDWQMVEGL
jgi:hypothetical protein